MTSKVLQQQLDPLGLKRRSNTFEGGKTTFAKFTQVFWHEKSYFPNQFVFYSGPLVFQLIRIFQPGVTPNYRLQLGQETGTK